MMARAFYEVDYSSEGGTPPTILLPENSNVHKGGESSAVKVERYATRRTPPAPAAFKKILRLIISRVLSKVRARSLPAGKLVQNLHLYRTDQSGGHEPGRIFGRTGVKDLRFAQDHAIEKRVGYRNLQ